MIKQNLLKVYSLAFIILNKKSNLMYAAECIRFDKEYENK